ncbi:hypothetical protein [Bradyrhizobium sp. URHD0069]|uniref:DUF6894 family protein n=1 Tax=Bradyrhizobium sp. URHD0069 TaxID=1380355 RepID=UPI000496773C|nr:hypothetical protein [Bradyrhizobium sp. URHD0069]
MARYFFHLVAGDHLILDEEGTELPDLAAAQREAKLGARELLGEAIKSGEEAVADGFVIANEAGHTLETFSFSEIMPKPFRR